MTRAGLGLLLLAGCGGNVTSSGSTAARIFLNWFPEAEHGGYYAAEAAGAYRERGVAVTLLPGGPQAPVIARVASGDVEFGVVNADDVVLARAAGAPLVALLAPIQTSPACIMVHRASGIERLGDLRDVTLAINVAAANYRWLQRTLPLTNVTIVPYAGTIAEFLVNPRYAQQAYAFSEPLLAEVRGSDPRCLPVAATGFDPYASVLVAREALVRDQPGLAGAVTAAVALGWQRYVADPGPANALIQAANPAIDADTLARGAAALRPLVQTPATRRIGEMSAERWSALARQLADLGLVDHMVPAASLWDGRFLPPT